MKACDSTSQTTSVGSASGVSCRGKLAYLAMVVAAAGLAVTGIGSMIAGKLPMTHWVLMAHVSFAPLFAIGLAGFSVLWAFQYRGGTEFSEQSCVNKSFFWLILLLGLTVILSGVVPMTPVFGTAGDDLLRLTHRYSAVALTFFIILHRVTLAKSKGV